MGSGQPYLKSGTFARLKHTILYGKMPVWAFIIVSSILLLLLVGVWRQLFPVKVRTRHDTAQGGLA